MTEPPRLGRFAGVRASRYDEATGRSLPVESVSEAFLKLDPDLPGGLVKARVLEVLAAHADDPEPWVPPPGWTDRDWEDWNRSIPRETEEQRRQRIADRRRRT